MGQDERRKHEEQQRRAAEGQRAFTNDVRMGMAAPRDRVGNLLRVEDLLMFHPTVDVFCRVADIQPALDPRLPPFHVMVTLELKEPPILVPVNVPWVHFMKIADGKAVEEAQRAAAAATPPAGESAQTPPPADTPDKVLEFPPRQDAPNAAPPVDGPVTPPTDEPPQ